MPEIFEHISEVWKKIDGKMKAEAFKLKILSCVRAWEDWAIYPKEYLVRLQNMFLGLVKSKNETNYKKGIDIIQLLSQLFKISIWGQTYDAIKIYLILINSSIFILLILIKKPQLTVIKKKLLVTMIVKVTLMESHLMKKKQLLI